MTLRIGITAFPHSPSGLDLVREAERLGVDSIWVPEFWAFDAFTPLAYLAAVTTRVRLATGIAQLGARTPAALAMTSLSIQALSGGRFVLGIGASGPQVMEGWHGVRFDRPVQRTRETIEIIRAITAGERLEYHGKIHSLPLPDGEGRAIRSPVPPTHVPIYVASLGPANLRLTGELADGWIGNSFFPETAEVFLDPIRQGAAAAGRDPGDLDLTVAASLEFTDDVDEAGRRHAEGFAFTFGAMGSATTNFYNDAFARQGYGDDVREVQRLWLAGDRDAAAKRVPTAIGLGTNLIGSDTDVKERLRLYRDAAITTLRVGLRGDLAGPDSTSGLDRQVDDLGRLLELVSEVNSEPAVARSPERAGAGRALSESPSRLRRNRRLWVTMSPARDRAHSTGGTMALQVVGAGVGRTGTNSLKVALERLLGGTCHHMVEVFAHPEEIPEWIGAIDGRTVDWTARMQGYTALVDWPGASFWRELAAANPDALVLLSYRDPEDWYRSATNTIFAGISLRASAGDEWMAAMGRLMAARFSDRLDDREAMIAAYERHNAEVRREVPAERLLEWTPNDGWEPICERLGLPVPEEAFPVTNTTAEFRESVGMPPLG